MHKRQFDQLTQSQKRAVLHKDGPLLVIAGPGSGKTRVITYRIASLIESGVKPWNICAITFTNKAAEEMRQRAETLGHSRGAQISTFHSLCVRILRQYSGRAQINSNFSIYDSSDQSRCMKQAVKDCNYDTSNFSPARMLNAVSTLKNKLMDAKSFESQAYDFFSQALAKIYSRYQQILTDNSAVDFDDLLMKTAILLGDCDDVRTELNDRYKYLLVDEYQDTNHAQYEIARRLVSEHSNICVTGDPDQSIYRWRGADIRNILAFETDWPDATVVKLEENFRSTANILAAADKLIAKNTSRKEKRLIATKEPASEVKVEGFDDEHAEARAVAARINQLREQGISLKDMAIFYRVNSMSRVLEEAFVTEQIPYQIVRGVEFYGRKEIRDLLGYLKILANPDDEIALMRVINTPARGIGKTTIVRVQNFALEAGISFYEALKQAARIDALSSGAKAKIAVFVSMIESFKDDLSGHVAPLAERVFTESGLEKSLQSGPEPDSSAIDNVNELINAAAQFDKQAEEPSLLDYLQQISLFSDADSYDATQERIAMMTLHAAKGLEFKTVFIIGLEEGLLPHERSSGDSEEMEEERRLFFVGITRAKQELYVSYAKYRTIRGQMLRSIPSQFLFEIGIGFREQQDQTEDDGYDDDIDLAEPRVELDVPYGPNELVSHKTFGMGRVQQYVDMGDNSYVVVKFNTGQTKSLMLKYAKLTKL